jgi:hypothetical protein
MTSDVIVLPRLFDFKILSVHGEKKNLSCGVVAQWSSRLPQEQKIAGSSPVWVDGFRNFMRCSAAVITYYALSLLLVEKNKCLKHFYRSSITCVSAYWSGLNCSFTYQKSLYLRI